MKKTSTSKHSIKAGKSQVSLSDTSNHSEIGPKASTLEFLKRFAYYYHALPALKTDLTVALSN
ncbi:MAG: hypothetical protein PHI48_08300 [Bacteroidales bacterium]|nr:hypothetical protein [Bacteroidales bacterium]MDD4822542.1 hypothetical protein [Bacteroidales bacterium]